MFLNSGQSSGDTSIVPTINTLPSPSSTVANKKDLENQEWYWGDITQEEVREIMAGLQDGYYLVRDASERSAAAFTLVVRYFLFFSVYRCNSQFQVVFHFKSVLECRLCCIDTTSMSL